MPDTPAAADPSLACRAAWTFALALLLSGCGEHAAPAPAAVHAPAPVAAASVPAGVPETDAWRGQWNGPEGTFLRIEGGQGRYDLTIRNLDGPRSFRGGADGASIRFERDGVRETLHATDGAATGMKWLAGKSTCLTVRPGEGYCRE